MEFTQLIAQRYSCKNFGAGRVDAAALHTILEAGRLAPTAKNTQEQRIYVVQSEEGLAKIDAATPCRYGAHTCSSSSGNSIYLINKYDTRGIFLGFFKHISYS